MPLPPASDLAAVILDECKRLGYSPKAVLAAFADYAQGAPLPHPLDVADIAVDIRLPRPVSDPRVVVRPASQREFDEFIRNGGQVQVLSKRAAPPTLTLEDLGL